MLRGVSHDLRVFCSNGPYLRPVRSFDMLALKERPPSWRKIHIEQDLHGARRASRLAARTPLCESDLALLGPPGRVAQGLQNVFALEVRVIR
jgi:hypothetical protein